MMTTRRIMFACLAIAVAVVAPARGRQEPTFRARTDGVLVSVVVRDNERAITNLTAEDFQLYDNGVLQQVTSTSSASVPVDVALVLDTSESLQGEAFARLKRDIQSMAALLKPDDRVRLVTFASRVVDELGLQPGNTTLPLDRLSAGGVTFLQNALAAALMIAPSTDRAQLAFAVTDGIGTSSLIDPRRLVKVAGYSSTTLYVALVPSGPQNISSLQQRRTYDGMPLLGLPGNPRPVVPHREALLDTVKAAGGRLYDAQVGDSLPGLFRRVLEDFRQSYVLRYAPRGVATTGWHEIVVKVPKRTNLVVRARKGYEGS